jgi:hypothetical protein
MARTVPRVEASNELQESDSNFELKVLLDQAGQDFVKHKIKERMAKAKRNSHLLVGSAFIFVVLTSLLMVLKFTGLL